MKYFDWIKVLPWVLPILACAGSGNESPDSMDVPTRLAACPDRPNCVSSQAHDSRHTIAPFRLKGDEAENWQELQNIIVKLPRSKIIVAKETYIHAEFRSRLFGFIDDLELLRDPVTGDIAVRSASRVGYSDFGVNRGRVEKLRQKLREAVLID